MDGADVTIAWTDDSEGPRAVDYHLRSGNRVQVSGCSWLSGELDYCYGFLISIMSTTPHQGSSNLLTCSTDFPALTLKLTYLLKMLHCLGVLFVLIRNCRSIDWPIPTVMVQ